MFGRVIANADIRVANEEIVYYPILKKLEGSYPLKKTPKKYSVMLDKTPVEGLPTLEARVDDIFSNIEFLFGVEWIGVGGKFPYKKCKTYPMARVEGKAYPVRDYPELGITKMDTLCFHSSEKIGLDDIRHMNWGEIDRIVGIDASKNPY